MDFWLERPQLGLSIVAFLVFSLLSSLVVLYVVRFQAGLNDIEGAASWAFMHGDLSVTYDGQWRVEELRKFKALELA